MSIKPSAGSEVRALIDSLGASDEIARETAIARLAIIGPRAVDRLIAEYTADTTDRRKRTAILRVLEATADARALGVARRALTDNGDLAVAAAGVLQSLLDSVVDGTAAEALDGLVTAALDPQVERRIRIAALDALQGMPEQVRSRVAAAVAEDPDPAFQSRTATGHGAVSEAIWQDALEGRLPDGAAMLRDAMQTRTAAVPLGELQKLVDAIRERESNVDAPQRSEWLAVRGGFHQALALRGSTVAVYDLRETITESTGALPTTFLTALHVVGDQSCLDAIATAYSRVAGFHDVAGTAGPLLSEEQRRWLQQLADAFHAIAKREKVAGTGATMKRLTKKWPGAVRALSKTSRTTPRPRNPDRT
ncbi:MAG: hypothetical protein ABIS06_10640 [Vicinamibacterales bacterium]